MDGIAYEYYWVSPRSFFFLLTILEMFKRQVTMTAPPALFSYIWVFWFKWFDWLVSTIYVQLATCCLHSTELYELRSYYTSAKHIFLKIDFL